VSATEKSAGRRVGLLVLSGAVALALVVGVAIGYLARGEPEAGDPVTIEGEIPAVTVTVPAGP
jgi:hypothetical protein